MKRTETDVGAIPSGLQSTQFAVYSLYDKTSTFHPDQVKGKL